MDLCYGKLNESVEANSIYTPAHAGKSGLSRAVLHQARDHPRLRGEKSAVMVCMPLTTGSPPPTRGKEIRSLYHPRKLGITPAHAGKSSATTKTSRSRGDHPRTRGEERICRRKRTAELGSPPHTRGKGLYQIYQRFCLRITPAYAGKSVSPTRIYSLCCRITPAYAGKSHPAFIAPFAG